MKKITKIEPSKQNDMKKLKVAAYCRVSTDMDDQLESLEAQKKHYEQVISENPSWIDAGIYYDEGLSAMKMKTRPELMRLLSDCRKGRVDFILTKSISRLSRNTTDYLQMVRELTALGIGIFFERENINTLEIEDEFMLSVLSSLAESELLSISENEKWSVQKHFMNGDFKQAIAPYGYYLDNGDLKIDKEKALIVRYIFDEALSGKGAYKIAKELNEREIHPMLTNHWNVSVIQNMLKNERYVGDVLYQKTFADSNYIRHMNHGERDQYLHQDHHDAIISRKQFDQVQKLISLHRNEKKIKRDITDYQQRYPFSGIIICEECGGHLKRKIIHSRVSGPYIGWECSTHVADKSKCSLKTVSEDVIKATFTTVTNKLIFSRKELLVPFVQAIRRCSSSDFDKQIEELNLKLEENTKKAQTMSSLAAENLLDPLVYRTAQIELTAERTELNSKKAILGVQMRENNRGILESGKFLKRISKMRISEDFDESLFTEFVKAVHVYSRVELGFEFTFGLIFREKVE